MSGCPTEPDTTCCNSLNDIIFKECKAALEKQGFSVTGKQYYGETYDPHEFPTAMRGMKYYHGSREINEFLEKYRKQQEGKPDTKVISSIQTPKPQ